MRRALLLLILTLILLAIPTAVLSEGPFTPASPEKSRRSNRRLLEDWRADPVHHARLENDLQAFWALPPGEREQLRELDRQIHQLPPDQRKRLLDVLDRYYEWLQRLPDDQRKAIKKAQTIEEKLAQIRQLMEQQWISRLPEKVRKEIDSKSGKEKEQFVKQLKKEERDWQKNWWIQFRPTRLEELPRDVQQFVKEVLRPLLPPVERMKLAEAEKQPWPAYVRALHDQGARVTAPIPGPIGPVYLEDLPPPLRQVVDRKPHLERELRSQEGKWPAFAITLRNASPPRLIARILDKRHTPAKPSQFSKPIQRFIEKDLLRVLNNAERRQLKQAEGEWPAYPQTLQRLADRHKLRIPGSQLPRAQDLWIKLKGEEKAPTRKGK